MPIPSRRRPPHLLRLPPKPSCSRTRALQAPRGSPPLLADVVSTVPRERPGHAGAHDVGAQILTAGPAQPDRALVAVMAAELAGNCPTLDQLASPAHQYPVGPSGCRSDRGYLRQPHVAPPLAFRARPSQSRRLASPRRDATSRIDVRHRHTPSAGGAAVEDHIAAHFAPPSIPLASHCTQASRHFVGLLAWPTSGRIWLGIGREASQDRGPPFHVPTEC